jgi:uncharacterized protein YcfJ
VDGEKFGNALGTKLGKALGTAVGDVLGTILGTVVGSQLLYKHEQKRCAGGYEYIVSHPAVNSDSDVGYEQCVNFCSVFPSLYVKYV